ncbi:MAG: bifunctional serine/threonine-protein kinase/formylglycine-generating enzyme family protein [Chthoniobacteraceae bacterium]
MSLDRTCPTCSAPLADGAPDSALCPACASSAAQRTVIDSVPVEPALASDTLTTIGDFEILAKLGAGGMGAVYKARQVPLDRLVALKVLPSQFADDPEYIGRFQREAKVAASLHHDNLVGVFSYGSADGVHFIAMELVEGENLHQLLRSRRVDMAEALGITDYVAQALKCGWETAQLVHRDIKPSNIYLSFDGKVKVGDLGLAKSLTSNTTGITQTGTMMGTPHYMSPEQCRGDKTIDFRADIYSLGCMLFEMLTGAPPYPGSDPVAIVHKHLNAPPPGLLKALPGCPLPVALLVGRMLKKNARDRHASYDELIAEIEALYEHLERGEALDVTQFRRPVQRVTPATTVSEGMPEWVWWSVVALVAVALAIIFMPKPKPKPPVAAATPTAAPATPRPSPIAAATPVGQAPRLPAGTPAPPASGALALQSATALGPWQPLFTDAEWKERKSRKQIVDGRMNLQGGQQLMKPLPAADGAIRARIQVPETGNYTAVNAREVEGIGVYKLQVSKNPTSAVVLIYFPWGGNGIELVKKYLPQSIQPSAVLLLELRVQGNRLTALVDGAVFFEAQDARVAGPGRWGIIASDGWFESVEVQTPLPAPADGWEDLLAQLTPERLTQDGDGWLREGRALRSPNRKYARLPLGQFAGSSYQVRARLQQLIAKKDGLTLLLPVGDRLVGFTLDGLPADGYFTGVNTVEGKRGKDLPGSILGQVVKDSEWHDLEVTVRLDGAQASISSTLDARPLYAWSGPIAGLNPQWPKLAQVADTLALVSFDDDWRVAELKAKRLGAADATKDAPFVNTLGMKFVPVPIVGGPTAGKTVLFSVWDTRVQDYAVFATETQRERPKPGYEPGPMHPAAGVSWDDATAFCAWLTERERQTGGIGASAHYRLPSDHEWSCAVGIGEQEDAARLPGEKNGKIAAVFPWGTAWPPPDQAGNYGSEELRPLLAAGKYAWIKRVLPGRHDGFAETSPVGSYAANRFGLYDMGGNVWQWCSDSYDKAQKDRVLRGASWERSDGGSLLSSSRLSSAPAIRGTAFGFRVVLALPAETASTAAPAAAPAADKDGWEDLLARLTPAIVAQTGHGWSLKDSELFSPDTKFATLPLPGKVSGTSYQVRVTLRRLAGKWLFLVVLPVADRMCGFELEGGQSSSSTTFYTGLNLVNGKSGKNLPGVVEGKQVNDPKPHELEVTVRLDGANATITTTLDTRPLYEWTGPTSALSQHKDWATTEPGALALGTFSGGWAVSEVKLKRLAP